MSVARIDSVFATKEELLADYNKALVVIAKMQASLEAVLEVAEFIDDETGHQSKHIKAALASAKELGR